MKISRFAMAALLTAILPAASWAAGRIVVQKKALVRGPIVTLGEVAKFEGVSASERQSLESREMGAAAPPAKSFMLNRAQVKGRIYNAGVNIDRYTLVIPDQVTFITRAEIITGQRLMKSAVDLVSSQLESVWTGSPSRVEIAGLPADVVLPAGEYAVEPVMESRANRYGRVQARVEIRQGGRAVRKLDVGNYLRVYVTVLAAKRNLSRGAVLQADDLQSVEADLATLKTGAVNLPDTILGRRLTRGLQVGEILTDSAVELVPDINVGDMVQLVSRGDGFEITMMVKALEKGRKGDIIRVQNTSSHKVLDARVVDSGTVELVNPK